jgi:hypothetical protein
LLRRFLVLAFVATSLQGCLATHDEKIYTRRVPPTQEELDALPPEPYEQAIRRQDAERERLRVPFESMENTIYLDEGRRLLRPSIETPRDPETACEADRIRVLQSRNWADVGSSPPPEVLPRVEPPIEENPFAPVPKSAKKKEELKEGEAPAEGGEKPGMGGDKKDEGVNKN